MGTAFSDSLNTDVDGVKTTATFDDIGDGTDDWFLWSRVADGGNVTVGAKADAAVEGGATSGSLVALLKGLQKAAVAPYPADQTPTSASSGVVANATAAAALAAVVGKTNYCTGFEITGAGATAAAVVAATVTGVTGGPLSYTVVFPASATTPITPVVVHFDPPLKASATNTAITVSVPAAGSGNTHVTVNVHGYNK